MDSLFQDIKILVLDVDGILTDGSIVYSNSGDELKSFNVKDGLGIRLLIESGIDVAVVTARESQIVKKRCKELGIETLFQNIKNKADVFNTIKEKFQLKNQNICYMGDDLIDIPIMKLSGVSATVPESCFEVQEVATCITEKSGGKGAVREICQKILKSQKLWEKAISRYTNTNSPESQ